MPGAKTYQKGTRAELAALLILKREGYYATRTPQSKGVFDIVAFRFNHLRLIQVKSYQDYPNPLSLANKIRDTFLESDLPCTGLHTWELWCRVPSGFRRWTLNPWIREISHAVIENPPDPHRFP